MHRAKGNVDQKWESVSGMLRITARMPGIAEWNLLLSLISAGSRSQETQARVNSFKAVWRCKMLHANFFPPLLVLFFRQEWEGKWLCACVSVGFKRVATPCCTTHKFYWGNSKRNLSSMAFTHVDSKEGQLQTRSWEFVGAHGPFSSALKHPPWPFVRLSNIFAPSIMKTKFFTRHKSP